MDTGKYSQALREVILKDMTDRKRARLETRRLIGTLKPDEYEALRRAAEAQGLLDELDKTMF